MDTISKARLNEVYMLARRQFLHLAFWTPPILLLASACSGARSGVTAQLDHGPTTSLGGTMTFTLTATSVWDAPSTNGNGTVFTDAEISLLLSDGIELLSSGWSAQVLRVGTASYTHKVTFKANQSQTFEINVRLNKEGEHEVAGSAEISQGQEGTTNSATDALYLKVTSNSVVIQRSPFSS